MWLRTRVQSRTQAKGKSVLFENEFMPSLAWVYMLLLCFITFLFCLALLLFRPRTHVRWVRALGADEKTGFQLRSSRILCPWVPEPVSKPNACNIRQEGLKFQPVIPGITRLNNSSLKHTLVWLLAVKLRVRLMEKQRWNSRASKPWAQVIMWNWKSKGETIGTVKWSEVRGGEERGGRVVTGTVGALRIFRAVKLFPKAL